MTRTRTANGGPVRSSTSQIYAVPAWLALASMVGLVAALLGDGSWDALSWVALGAPVAVTLGALAAAGRAPAPRRRDR
jgi:hypothetical protein